jgi:hypothetical protein
MTDIFRFIPDMAKHQSDFTGPGVFNTWAESEGISHFQLLRRTVMKHKLLYSAVIAALLPVLVSVANAADQDRTRDQDQLKTQDKDQISDRQIYGSQLMTQEERNAYRTQMRNAKTAQEREQIRKQHHEQMKVRAKEKGVTLPDEPPARGKGRGMGPGGGGMGPGNGSGVGPGGGGMGGMGPGPRRY